MKHYSLKVPSFRALHHSFEFNNSVSVLLRIGWNRIIRIKSPRSFNTNIILGIPDQFSILVTLKLVYKTEENLQLLLILHCFSLQAKKQKQHLAKLTWSVWESFTKSLCTCSLTSNSVCNRWALFFSSNTSCSRLAWRGKVLCYA